MSDEIHTGPSASWEDVARVRQEVIERLRADHEAELAALRAKLAIAEDAWQMANGTADLAMKHRDMAEAELAAMRAEKVSQCGHPSSLLLRSAETGKALYCELCDERKRRRDAESMEEHYKAELAALRAERDELRAAGKDALHALTSSRVFVTSRERCHHPDGTAWYDERVERLRAALGER